MNKFLALFLLILFATIALPIRGSDSFCNTVAEEEIISEKKLETNGIEIVHFGMVFLTSSIAAKLNFHYSVMLAAHPFLSEPGQPPNYLV